MKKHILTTLALGAFTVPFAFTSSQAQAQSIAFGSSVQVTGSFDFVPTIVDPSNPAPGTLTNLNFSGETLGSLTGDFAAGTFAGTPSVQDFGLTLSPAMAPAMNPLFLPPNAGGGSLAFYDTTFANPFVNLGDFTLGGVTAPLLFESAQTDLNVEVRRFANGVVNAEFSSPSNLIPGEFIFNGVTIAEGSLTIPDPVGTNQFSLTLTATQQSPNVPEPSILISLAAISGIAAVSRKKS